MNVRGILEELGYKLADDRNYYRTKPLYRESKNPTSLRINKETGYFSDFSANIQGSLEELIRLTLNLDSIYDSREWLNSKGVGSIERSKPKIILQKEFDLKILDRLLPSYHFYTKKGISIDTLKLFKCGLATHGKMINRLVFPIINHKNTEKIIGFSGRDVLDKRANKWKHLGQKSEWCYPIFLNKEIIVEKDEIILVESIGDMLSLWEAGIKNVLVLFGVRLGREIKKQILSINPQKIIVATNNDENNVGQDSAKQIAKNLTSLMGNKVTIKLPTEKDFGIMSKEAILDWYSV